MRTLSIHAGLHFPKTVITMALAAAMLLFGCAVDPIPGYGVSASGCGMNAVLHCDLSPHGERCECVRHSELRELTKAFSTR